jgi:hypothetical protein
MTMSVDDLALSVQRAIDRLVRHVRRGAAPAATDQRRFLIVQIDGLSRDVLARALASGHMPFLGHLWYEDFSQTTDEEVRDLLAGRAEQVGAPKA